MEIGFIENQIGSLITVIPLAAWLYFSIDDEKQHKGIPTQGDTVSAALYPTGPC